MNKLDRARKFLGGVIRNTALAVAPLALLALAGGQAKADVVFTGDSGSFETLSAVNGVQGVKLYGADLCPEGPCSGLNLFWSGTYSGGSGSGFSIPVSYDFRVEGGSFFGSATSFFWTLFLSGTVFAFASGSGVVNPESTTAVKGLLDPVFFSGGSGFWTVNLFVSGFDLDAVTVPAESIDINPVASAVPEPSSVAMLVLSTGGGAMLMLRSRRRRQDATIRPDGIVD
jgi:hypothetical protein